MGDDVTEQNGPAEAAPSARADAPAPLALASDGTPLPKRIIVFSDGTGNSSGKLFKTNVFRLYQALDLGAHPLGQPTQIAYYDNGVGTSGVKLLAALGGVFGFGLRRNVLHLYRFVCRNYNDGDEIYAFGFSRGAFTIRLLVALICDQGIVSYRDERELAVNSADAFYRFTDRNAPDVIPLFWLIVVGIRNALRWLVRKFSPQLPVPGEPQRPDVDFVGVWDTVAAYGGPISEITRGIDKYVWPLTMTDYELPDKVLAARHALALDDERDSFWPLLWDEVAEARKAREPARDPASRARFGSRLQQVWFAGMHSDVGGGYPDESLSYVSLRWMIDQIGTRLRFIPERVRDIRSFANPFGPIHDSRKGGGVYYRYQPRKIAALLHKAVPDTVGFDETLILRDPTIGEKPHRPQGLLTGVNVHASVIERIGTGNDNYAPITLPRDFTVVDVNTASQGLAQSLVNLADPQVRLARGEAQEDLWDNVWRRRVLYYVSLLLTAVLVVSPLFRPADPFRPETDSRWVVDVVIGWFRPVVPGLAMPWYEAFLRYNWLFALIGLALWLVSAIMTKHARQLGDESRRAWWAALDGQDAPRSGPSRLREMRNSYPYQRVLQFWKWGFLPAVCGLGILAALFYVGLVSLAQINLVSAERTEFCAPGKSPTVTRADGSLAPFTADNPCFATGVQVKKDRRYRLYLAGRLAGAGGGSGVSPVPLAPPRDGTTEMAWTGRGTDAFPGMSRAVIAAFTTFRRVVLAGWLEPLVEIRETQPRDSWLYSVERRAYRLCGALGVRDCRAPFEDRTSIAIQRLGEAVRIDAHQPKGNVPGIAYVWQFTAQQDGKLFLFVNDAVLPLLTPDYFYRADDRVRNSGSAEVCVEEIHEIEDAPDRCRLAGVARPKF